jgi:hypothetical protein
VISLSAMKPPSADDATTSPYVVKNRSMGQPAIDLTKALQLSGELEDAELIRKMNKDT